jgi:hypothetical protein
VVVLIDRTIGTVVVATITETNEDLDMTGRTGSEVMETEGGVSQSGTIIMGAQTTALIGATQVGIIISEEEAAKHPQEWAATSVHEATIVEDDFLEVVYQIKPAEN